MSGETKLTERAMRAAVCMEVQSAVSTRTDAKAKALDEYFPGYDDMLAALRRAERFIDNGIELGFIRMPDVGTPDPAHDTLTAIRAAISKAEGRQ